MSHPSTRAERRHQRARVIARRRFVYLHIWYSRIQERTNPLDRSYLDGWEPRWGKYAKWNLGCGCKLCHEDKYFGPKRKRREALKRAGSDWDLVEGDE